MAFPFDCRRDISFVRDSDTDVERFQALFIESARRRFERAHVDIEISGNEISFKSFTSLMPFVSSGKIILHPEGSVTYYLNFTGSIIVMSVFILGILGWSSITTVGGWLLGRIVIIIGLWLAVVFATRWAAISRFEELVTDVYDQMFAHEQGVSARPGRP